MRLALLGAPGAGKGTLAGSLKEKLNVVHLSAGDLLREQLKNNTPLGQEAKKYIEAGELVPDDLVIKLIRNKLVTDEKVSNGFMLDGFPRTQAQAEALDNILTEIDMPLDTALYMNAAVDVIIQRLTGRRVCKTCGALFHVVNMPPKEEGVCDACSGELYQRPDDNESTIKTRMEVYIENTKPIVDYYKDKGILKEVNADQDAPVVFETAMTLFNENR